MNQNKISTPLTLFICDPWESYMRQLEAQNDRDYAAFEFQEDLDQEEVLARQYVEDTEDGLEPEWPEYAKSPIEIVEPEIIEHAELGDQYGLGLHRDDAEREPYREDEPQAWYELHAELGY